MSKLRLLKDDEIDLHELDGDPLILNSEPYAFLCAKKLNPLLVTRALDIFNLSVRGSPTEIVLVCKDKSENYKLDALNLLGAAFFLHMKDTNQKMFLGVSKSLMGLLSQAKVAEKDLLKGEELELGSYDYTKSCLTLSQQVQYALHQVGLDVLTNSPYLALDKNQVSELYAKFTKKEPKRRVG
jgi:hypothetical protein